MNQKHINLLLDLLIINSHKLAEQLEEQRQETFKTLQRPNLEARQEALKTLEVLETLAQLNTEAKRELAKVLSSFINYTETTLTIKHK